MQELTNWHMHAMRCDADILPGLRVWRAGIFTRRGYLGPCGGYRLAGCLAIREGVCDFKILAIGGQVWRRLAAR